MNKLLFLCVVIVGAAFGCSCFPKTFVEKVQDAEILVRATVISGPKSTMPEDASPEESQFYDVIYTIEVTDLFKVRVL